MIQFIMVVTKCFLLFMNQLPLKGFAADFQQNTIPD